MRVAIITSPTAPVPPERTGPEQQLVATLVDGLVARGHAVTLYASGDSRVPAGAQLRAIQPRSVQAAAADYRRDLASPHAEALVLPISHLRAIEHVAWSLREIERSGADVVHTHSLLGPALAVGQAIPHVNTRHAAAAGGLFLSEADATRFHALHLAELASLQRIRYVCVSAAQRAIWPGPARVVHNGIDVARFPLGTDPREYLLVLGRIAPEKGTHLAIEAARRVGLPLVIAGPTSTPLGDPYYFEQLVKPRLGGNIRYVGEVDHAGRVELYRGAIALLAPLQCDESFGLTFVEAMACGTPVIAFARGAAAEVIRDGVSGWVVGDLDAMCARIRDPLDPAAIRAHVVATFSAERMVAGYEQAYRDAIAGSDW
jgi:glycosyltransferase involved in cell wall biosynthesis